MRRPPVIIATVLGLVASSPAAPAADAAKVTFQDGALPILRQRCGSCHNADKKTAGLDVTTYAGIMAGGGSGDVVKPGDATGSHLFRVVNHDDEPTMPPDGPPIPEAERQILRAWIDGGVLEHAGSVAAKTKKLEVAFTAPATERPAVQPLPGHLPLEPVVRTAAVDACASLATSPWAPLAAVCGQKQVLLYRTDSLELAGVLPFPEGRPHVVRFSRGGGLVLAAGGVGATSGRVVVWNLRNGRRIRTLGDELDVVLAADVSPDQRSVVLGGPQRMVRVYSLETGDKRFEMKKHTDWIQAAAYSPDGVLLATGDRSGGVVVWEAATGRDYLVPASHPAAVTALAWRGDSNMLATACEDGQIRLFELENGNQVKAWAAHPGGVAAVSFTRDGRLASVGRDRVPKLWKPDGAQERAFEQQPDVGLATAFCDETGRLLAGDWTGQIAVWSAADGARVGGLDQNPPRLAERVAAAGQGLAVAQGALAEAEKAAAAATATAAAAPPEQMEAARGEEQALQARAVDLQTQVAAAAAAQARWLGEVAFQGRYGILASALAARERELAAAEAAVAEAEATQRAAEEVRRGYEAARSRAQQQADALAAQIAALEKEAQDIAGANAAIGARLTAAQQRIDQIGQAIAMLDRSAESLAQGLEAIPGQAELTAALNATVAAKPAHEAERAAMQQQIAALSAERQAGEQAVGEKQSLIERQRQELVSATAAVADAARQTEASTPAITAAAGEVQARKAAAAERQALVAAAAAELDTLQGTGG